MFKYFNALRNKWLIFARKEYNNHIISNFTIKPNTHITSYLYFILYTCEVNIRFVNIFDFQVLLDLHISGCPEYSLTTFGGCLSICYINLMACLNK